jgi:hypothetical protein
MNEVVHLPLLHMIWSRCLWGVSSTQCLLLLFLCHLGFKWWLFLGGRKKRDKQTNEHADLSIGVCSRVSRKKERHSVSKSGRATSNQKSVVESQLIKTCWNKTKASEFPPLYSLRGTRAYNELKNFITEVRRQDRQLQRVWRPLRGASKRFIVPSRNRHQSCHWDSANRGWCAKITASRDSGKSSYSTELWRGSRWINEQAPTGTPHGHLTS